MDVFFRAASVVDDRVCADVVFEDRRREALAREDGSVCARLTVATIESMSTTAFSDCFISIGVLRQSRATDPCRQPRHCVPNRLRDARMIGGTTRRKGRDTKTAWEGVVMVAGDVLSCETRWEANLCCFEAEAAELNEFESKKDRGK